MYNAPPNQTRFVLRAGDTLNIDLGSMARGTTINGGMQNVRGQAFETTINAGEQAVFAGGYSLFTKIWPAP